MGNELDKNIIAKEEQIDKLCDASVELIHYARNIVVNHVNTVQLMTYYSLGRWIVETQQMAKHEQNMEAGLLKHYQKNCKKNLARDFQKIL